MAGEVGIWGGEGAPDKGEAPPRLGMHHHTTQPTFPPTTNPIPSGSPRIDIPPILLFLFASLAKHKNPSSPPRRLVKLR